MATRVSGNGGRQRHRRRMILLLVVAMALLAWLIWGMASDLRSQPVTYYAQRAAAVNPYLCPGETLRYEVHLSVTDVPTVLDITESWCRAGENGICARALTTTYRVPVLEPRLVYTIANRIMPESDFFRPGDKVEFVHATQGEGQTTGYIVGPVTIRDNCESAGSD